MLVALLYEDLNIVLLYCYVVISLSRYATISVPIEVKRILERAKGDMEWGDFLLKLYLEVKRLKGEEAFRRLVEFLSDEDLEGIARSSREFREGFVFK